MSQSAQAGVARLEEIVGGAHVLTDPIELSAREVDGVRPSAVVRPADALQIGEVIRFASSEKLAVIPCGGCTKLGIGSPPSRYDIALDLTRMNHVLAYDPRDLTLGVEPGMRIADLSPVLAEQNQFLPLVVPFFDRATLGGIVAANSSSSLRHSYGSVRDFCLGMELVTGDGSQAKSGGRVVKNVTGYDLHKLLIGSLGTLAVITRVNFRTFPLHSAQGTFVASFSGSEAAFTFCRAIAQSVLTPQFVEVVDPGSAHLIFSAETPARIAPRLWSVIISAAGHATVVERHARELGHMAAAANAEEFMPLTDKAGASTLDRLREFPRFVREVAPSAIIFRIAILPTAMSPLLTRLQELATQNNLKFAGITRASGLAFAAFFPKEGDPPPFIALAKASVEVFQACAAPEINARAMLEFGPPQVKRIGGVWGLARPDFELMQRIKKVFDPQNVFSPGRFAGEIKSHE